MIVAADRIDDRPRAFSGGMQQRLAIGQALAAKPRILLLDEPFGALDAQTRASMQAHLLEIWKSVDIAVVFITHDLATVRAIADDVVVMHPGPINRGVEMDSQVADGPRSVILQQVSHGIAVRMAVMSMAMQVREGGQKA